MERLNEWPIADERSLAREACRIFYGYGEDSATPTNHDLAAMQAVLKWYESVLPRVLRAGTAMTPNESPTGLLRCANCGSPLGCHSSISFACPKASGGHFTAPAASESRGGVPDGAADEIERLRAEVATLRDQLAPFFQHAGIDGLRQRAETAERELAALRERIG